MGRPSASIQVSFVVLATLLGWTRGARGDAEPAQAPPEDLAQGEAPAAESEPVETDLTETPAREIKDGWSEYDLKFLTFKWGIFTIDDWGTAAQSAASEAQVDVVRAFKVRDLRLSFSGKLATERSITYTTGLMYDGNLTKWFVRETGIQVGIPELWGNVFIGRQKEGISLSKIDVGYAGWMMERQPISDAVLPILADGIKWLGVAPNLRANWNLAVFYNQLPDNPSTDWYDRAVVARFCFLPLHPGPDDEDAPLLHLGLGYHWGRYADDQAQLDSKPESSTAPVFVDTGEFPAEHDNLFVPEIYFRKGSWFTGAEYFLDFVHAPLVGNPLFHGGEAFVSWLITGEVRPYIDLGGKFGFVEPKRSAFSGGPGAWEVVLHFSYTDLDSGGVTGGRFWRLTPQVNWYVDNMLSVRVNYGLGFLDRFGTGEFTNFFQARLQIQFQ